MSSHIFLLKSSVNDSQHCILNLWIYVMKFLKIFIFIRNKNIENSFLITFFRSVSFFVLFRENFVKLFREIRSKFFFQIRSKFSRISFETFARFVENFREIWLKFLWNSLKFSNFPSQSFFLQKYNLLNSKWKFSSNKNFAKKKNFLENEVEHFVENTSKFAKILNKNFDGNPTVNGRSLTFS